MKSPYRGGKLSSHFQKTSSTWRRREKESLSGPAVNAEHSLVYELVHICIRSLHKTRSVLRPHWYSLRANLRSLFFSSKWLTRKRGAGAAKINITLTTHTEQWCIGGKKTNFPWITSLEWQTLTLTDPTADRGSFLHLVEFQTLKQLYEGQFSNPLQASTFCCTSTVFSISVLLIAARCWYLLSFSGTHIRMQSSATYL